MRDSFFRLENIGGICDLFTGEEIAPGELRKQALHGAISLRSQGIGRADNVVIAHGGTVQFFADLFAVWLSGGCAICLNASLTVKELENVVRFVEPKAVITRGERFSESSIEGVPCLDLSEDEGEALTVESSFEVPAEENDPALILFTSGTTGQPKGVVHTFRSLGERLARNRAHISRDNLARTLCVLPTHFGHGLIGNCLTPLSAGRDLFLFQNPGIAGAARLGKVIDDHGITFLSSVPSFWKLVLKMSPSPEGNSLKQVSVGSAPLSRDLWLELCRWSGVRNVLNMYGITETANWASGISAAEKEPEDGLVGKMWGGEAAVLSREGDHLTVGEGELLLKPPSLMQGYFRRDDLTSEVVRDGWYHTGDWGSIDAGGIIRLLGRTKTEINKAGIKILPEEIDLLLESHPEVTEACAFGVPDPVSGETVAVAICVMSGCETKISDLKAWCRERIRPDGVPEKWFLVAEIPKTDRGKVNRRIVREHCQQHHA